MKPKLSSNLGHEFFSRTAPNLRQSSCNVCGASPQTFFFNWRNVELMKTSFYSRRNSSFPRQKVQQGKNNYQRKIIGVHYPPSPLSHTLSGKRKEKKGLKCITQASARNHRAGSDSHQTHLPSLVGPCDAPIPADTSPVPLL